MSRSPAKSGKAIAMKSLKEKWEHSTIRKRERGKWDRGVLYRNITPIVASRPQLEYPLS